LVFEGNKQNECANRLNISMGVFAHSKKLDNNTNNTNYINNINNNNNNRLPCKLVTIVTENT
jgi:hypothetical protein